MGGFGLSASRDAGSQTEILSGPLLCSLKNGDAKTAAGTVSLQSLWLDGGRAECRGLFQQRQTH